MESILIGFELAENSTQYSTQYITIESARHDLQEPVYDQSITDLWPAGWAVSRISTIRTKIPVVVFDKGLIRNHLAAVGASEAILQKK